MKRFTTAVALLALSTGVSQAADEPQQAFLGIFAETAVMKMAGMKTPELPKLPPGFKLPASAQAAFAQFAPQRKLSVRLWVARYRARRRDGIACGSGRVEARPQTESGPLSAQIGDGL